MSDVSGKTERVMISKPNLQTVAFNIRGSAPYVQNAFSEKAKEEMKAKQQKGSLAGKGKKKEAKDFDACYQGALHVSDDGWYGIPASSFRAAAISACRLVGFKMTIGKLSIFIEADGFDAKEGTPLVRITKGEPKRVDHFVRNETGVADIRPRPMWREGWEAILRVKFDADQFTTTDVANLLMRVGDQVGIGEGRPDSKRSSGMGWGTFNILTEEDSEKAVA